MTGRKQQAMQSDTHSITAAHRELLSVFYNTAGEVIETYEHKGDFKDW